MTVWGLNILDLLIIIVYTAVILWLGRWAGRKTKDTGDFYLAGRKLGKVYQFFLNFGCSTNADQAVAVSREIYRQGIGGMWIQYLVLFLTPFYWFTALFFRRVRLTTIGDFFSERFRSAFLGAGYAVFILLASMLGGGVGYMVAAKTLMALTPKTIEQCTVEERRSIEEFVEFQVLKAQRDQNALEAESEARYDELNEKNKRGELRSFVSFTDPLIFYLIYAVIVAIYTMLGGFRAAAITDSIQGVLIIIFSLILIPVGLHAVGGFSGLHASVPEYMFELFGTAALSEYAWYTIVAMVIANLVSIIAVAHNMQTAGSAKNEATARFGMIFGMFFKRFIMIFWALAGLLAIGLYAGQLHDPDLIWGFMTRDLLFPGAIGLMLVGILAANMSTLDAGSVAYSALVIKNIYEPLKPDRSEKHYLGVGRIVIAGWLFGGVAMAIAVDNLLELFKYMITIPGIFGAPLWIGFTWRRLTKWAVIIQVTICIFIYALIPNLFQTLNWSKHNEAFLLQTRERTVEVVEGALSSDVEQGRAAFVGKKIKKERIVAPSGVFFARVARTDPEDPDSPKIGLGRFNAEIWVLSWLGIDFTRFSKAQLVATRFIFDALFPFFLLFLFSYLTRPVDAVHLDRFYAKLHTPVQPSAELDAKALDEAYADPDKYRPRKLFPRSQWEIMKPGWNDVVGFGGSWLLVGVIIALLIIMVSIK